MSAVITSASAEAFSEEMREPPAATVNGHHIDYAERFKYPGLALGLSLVIGPMELAIGPAVVGIVIAKASLPTFKRTLKIIQTGQPTVDLLDSLWILFHTVTGELLAPALAICLTEAGNTLRDLTAMEGRRQLPQLVPNRQYWIERNGRRRLVLLRHLALGDHVLLGPGDLVPADGKVVRGEGLVDQNALTGASKLLSRNVGDKLFASTVVANGQLVLEIEHMGADTRASRMAGQFTDETRQDTRVSNLMEEMGNQAVVPAIATAAVVFALSGGNVHRGLAPLQLDFAQGIGIGAPVPVITSMQKSAANQVLVRGGHALEQLAKVDAIVFDKTGTLTQRGTEIVAVQTAKASVTEQELLYWAASASYYVVRPFSVALVQHVERRGITLDPCDPLDFSDVGVAARVKGSEIAVGSIHFIEERGIAVDAEYHRMHKGVILDRSIRYVARDGELLGAVFYTNPLRPESATAIKTLQDLGITCYLLTGDNSKAANAVAYKLNIKPGNTFAEASSGRKAEVLVKLRQQHQAIAYVGDGTNDVPAMAKADVSVSFRHASDLAREAADVVLLDDSLLGLPYGITMARQAMGLVHQNIVLVTAANIAVVTGGVFFNMSPLLSVVMNNGSTLLAGLNGLRPLRDGQRLDPEIESAVIRGEDGLLGMPWRKRKRSGVEQLLAGRESPYSA
jgi:heavy metal translocating P-type ATPase